MDNGRTARLVRFCRAVGDGPPAALASAAAGGVLQAEYYLPTYCSRDSWNPRPSALAAELEMGNVEYWAKPTQAPKIKRVWIIATAP